MALSGQTAVTTAGTAVALGSQACGCPVMVKALTTNTGLMYVGNDAGDVASTNGMPLAAGDVLIFERLVNLSDVWVDGAVNGEKVAWLLLRAGSFV